MTWPYTTFFLSNIFMADIIHNITEMDNLKIATSVACDLAELSHHCQVKKTDLTIIAQNIRSVYHNFDDFLTNISTLTFETDIVILTECRLDPNKPIPQLNNYLSCSTTSQLNQNDGVIIYVKRNLKPKIKEIKLTHASCLQIDILNHTILGIYRSPSILNPEGFINSLCIHLNSINSSNNLVIAGDININLLPKPNESLQDIKNRMTYLNMLSTYGILPGHKLPTRQNSCIDHFMLKINCKRHSAFIAILKTTVTDHDTTFLAITKTKTNMSSNKTRTKINFENAKKYLITKNLTHLLLCTDPNLITQTLIQTITESLKENSTILKIPKSQRIVKPWMTRGILNCIKNRNKLQKELRKDPENQINKITYTRYRNFLNKLIKKTKRNYDRNLINNTIKNNKLLWKNIKTLTYKNKNNSPNTELIDVKSTPLESANYVNNFFTNIGKNLANDIQSTITKDDTNMYLQNLPSQSQSFVLLNTDIDEVNSIISNLKPDSAPGWDNIPTRYIQYIKDDITPIIVHLANICFETGTFPSLLKTSVVTPIHKGGNGEDVNNYRPISVITVLAKILEKLLNIRLLNYLDQHKILSASQFGFRKGISTEDAVSSLTSFVINNLDKGTKCASCFIDLKKAFDTVSVPILVQKLGKIGIRGVQLALFNDYLTGRTQRVKLDDTVSDTLDVTYGVPQGSVLGPTLFLIYINDLCETSLNNAKIFTYADDTAIVFSGTNWNEVRKNAEEGMAWLANWLKLNLLTLNTSKTNYICFSINRKTQPNQDFDIKIHTCGKNLNCVCSCPSITKVKQTKYLGIILDDRLSWYAQIEQITDRVRKYIWMFKTLRHILSKKLLNEIYISLVQSVITYCIRIWGGALKTRFLEVERVQRTLIKVMYFKMRTFSTNELYKLSDLLSVRKLYIYSLVLNKHKALPYVSDNEGRRNRRRDVAHVPRVQTQFAGVQLDFRAAVIYNKINNVLHIYNKPYHECKSTLITWLKSKSYDELETFINNLSL